MNGSFVIDLTDLQPRTATTDAPMRPVDMPAGRAGVQVGDYWMQPKYDGWYVVFKAGRAYTRHGRDITDWACWDGRALPWNAVGELMHTEGRHRIQSLRNSPEGLRVVLFDLPGAAPIEQRLAGLPRVADLHGFESAPAWTCETWEQADRLRVRMQQEGHEGLVLKRAGSAWTSGDCGDWVRFKA